MDSTDDTTQTTTEGAADEASKQQFLDALLAAGHGSHPTDFDREPIEESGVALSSNPDPVDLPGAPVGPASARPDSTNSPNKPQIMYSIDRGPGNDADEPVADETETTSVEARKETGEDEGLLLLSCPKCGGELALHEEHIGIEGACVWCEAPIVAGRTGSDRTVKVFAIATGTEAGVETPAAEAPAGDEEGTHPVPDHQPTEVARPDEPAGLAESDVPAGWGSPSPDKEGEAPATPVEQPADTAQAEEPAGFPGSDIPTGWGAPAPAEEKSDTVEAEISQEGSTAPTPEGPAPGEGFGTPPEAPAKQEPGDDIFEGFSSPSPASEGESAPERPSRNSGFGEFLSSAAGSAKTEPPPESSPFEDVPSNGEAQSKGFSGPTPWGPPTQLVAEQPPSAPTGETPASPGVGEDAAPAGFSAPAGNEPPSRVAPADDFAAPTEWGTPAPAPSVSPSEEVPGPSEGFSAPASFDEAPAPLADGKPETPSDSPNIPGPPFSPSTPDRHKTDEAGEDSPVGFNIPSSEPSGSPFPPFGPTDAAPGPIEEPAKSEAAGENVPANPDSAPTPAPPFGASPQAGPSLFGSSPKNTNTPAVEAPSNPFGEEKAAEESKPSVEAPPAPEPEQQDSAEPAPAKQQVDSVTLGKKKPGKGFYIITAITLGLVCGAALASFVLPVDEYVKSARSLMEQKFMPSATWESAENSAPPPAQPSPTPDN